MPDQKMRINLASKSPAEIAEFIAILLAARKTLAKKGIKITSRVRKSKMILENTK